jgi:hypothetical protein
LLIQSIIRAYPQPSITVFENRRAVLRGKMFVPATEKSLWEAVVLEQIKSTHFTGNGHQTIIYVKTACYTNQHPKEMKKEQNGRNKHPTQGLYTSNDLFSLLGTNNGHSNH